MFLLSLLAVTPLSAAPVKQPAACVRIAPRPYGILSIELIDHFQQTQGKLSFFSHGNYDVLKGGHLFLQELQRVYLAGEGMIEDDMHRILDAVAFAAEKHQFQTRKNALRTPYIVHPVAVAYHIVTVGDVRDPDIIIAALLHDTVEDTNTSFDEIRASFGERVERFVRELTDDKSLPKMERKQLQIVHAPHKSAGAAQIKLADKWHNLNDIMNHRPVDWSDERVDAYFKWAARVVNALPWVNAPLKIAVDDTIHRYWHT